MECIRLWVNKRLTEYLTFEDDVIVEYVISELTTKEDKGPCPKRMQIYLTGVVDSALERVIYVCFRISRQEREQVYEGTMGFTPRGRAITEWHRK